jgi:hypothetical protein
LPCFVMLPSTVPVSRCHAIASCHLYHYQSVALLGEQQSLGPSLFLSCQQSVEAQPNHLNAGCQLAVDHEQGRLGFPVLAPDWAWAKH